MKRRDATDTSRQFHARRSRVSGELFVDQSVELDGKHFTRCTFTNCILEYHGGNIMFERTAMKGAGTSFVGTHGRSFTTYRTWG